MKYIRNTTDFYIEENTVLSLGKFDGIHRGHEQLLQYFAKKKDEGLAGAIFTFDIPPRRNVQNVEAKVLTTNEEKRHMFERLGIDYVVECPFTPGDHVHGAGGFHRKDCAAASCKVHGCGGRLSFRT